MPTTLDESHGVVRAVGSSMSPGIRPGDWVILKQDPGSLRRGDVVVLARGGATVVHRVVRTTPPTEMGDAATTGAVFAPADVVGRAVAVARDGRTIDLTRPGRQIQARLLAFRSLARLAARRLNSHLPESRATRRDQ